MEGHRKPGLWVGNEYLGTPASLPTGITGFSLVGAVFEGGQLVRWMTDEELEAPLTPPPPAPLGHPAGTDHSRAIGEEDSGGEFHGADPHRRE